MNIPRLLQLGIALAVLPPAVATDAPRPLAEEKASAQRTPAEQQELDDALRKAAIKRDAEQMATLLAAGANPNGYESNPRYYNWEFRPLTEVADYHTWEAVAPSPECVRLLLAAGADPNLTSFSSTTNGTSPLLSAVGSACKQETSSKGLECVRLLLEAGADPNVRDKHGYTPLINAAEQGSLACIRMLLDAGAVTGARTSANRTALGCAAENPGQAEAVRLLLPGTHRDDIIKALLDGASVHGDMEEIMPMVEALGDFHLDSATAGRMMRNAATSGNAEWVEWLAAHGVDANAADDHGHTPLMCAENLAVAECLVGHGADVNAADDCGCTPLMFAKTLGVAECLVEHGADVNAKSSDGISVLLHIATSMRTDEARKITAFLVQRGAKPHGPLRQRPQDVTPCTGGPEILRMLVECGADHSILSDFKDKIRFEGDDPVTVPFAGQTRLLLQAGMDAKEKDRTGATLLHHAAYAGCAEIIPELIAAGGDANARDLSGCTPLMVAALRCNADAARALLAAGADVSMQDTIHFTPLMYAAQGGNVAVTRLLLDAGADTGAKEARGNTPLILAARQGNAKVVALLLEAGADANARNAEGQTALMLAVANGHVHTAKCLLEAGADPSIKDYYGKTAADRIWNSDELRQLFHKQPQDAQ